MADKTDFTYIKTIYTHLQDDTSRTIYTNRLLYNCTDDPRFIRAIINESPCIQKFIEDLSMHADQEKVLFGAGLYGKRLKAYFPEYDWIAFTDNNLSGSVVDGIPVLSVEQLIKDYSNSCIVISPLTNTGEMKDQLLSSGISSKNIVVLYDYIQSIGKDIYFDLPEMSRGSNEIFVDGGALDGSTSVDFANWAGGKFSGIYLFEPNPEMTQVITSRFPGQQNVKIIRKGLWNKPCDLYYSKNPVNTGEGIISEERLSPESKIVLVTSICLLHNKNVKSCKPKMYNVACTFCT